MWNAIRYVSSGFTLVAFVIAVAAYAFKRHIDNREKLIRTAPEEDRGELVRDALEFFHVETEGLTREQRYSVVLEQIHGRSKRFRIAAMATCIIAILASLILALALTRGTNPNNPPSVPTASSGALSPTPADVAPKSKPSESVAANRLDGRKATTSTHAPTTTTQPATINNCPNGICISGGTVTNPTVNNGAPQLKQRKLSTEQKRLILEYLKNHPPAKILLIRWPSYESQTYLSDFLEVLTAAKWSHEDLLLDQRPDAYKIRIGWKNNKSAADSLAEAFASAGVDFAEDEFSSEAAELVSIDVGVVAATREQLAIDRLQ